MNAPQYITDASGNRTNVILDIATYQELLDRLEELEDIAGAQDNPLRLPLKETLPELEVERAHIRNGEQATTSASTSTNSPITMREVVARLGDLALPGDGFGADLEAVQSSQLKVGNPEWHS